MGSIRVLLAGAGGYGAGYVRQLAQHPGDMDYRWVGVVDPYARRSEAWELICREGIPVYDTMEAFFAEQEADLAVIVTPIPLHAPQSITAMEHGCDVLLEKPIAGSTALGQEIIAAREKTGRRLFLGYQWCYDDAMLRLKTASDRGDFGRPLRMRSLVLWPRDDVYYGRNNWAGRALIDGQPVYDSVSSNATAHYLFNMLWLAGAGWQGAAPMACQAVTARANDIETFDTAAMRFAMPGGTEVLHIASHAAGRENQQEPMFLYEYEDAVIRFGGHGLLPGSITAEYRDGRRQDFGVSVLGGENKLRRVLEACRDPGLPVICPAEAALQHTRAIELAREADPAPRVFRDVQRDGGYVWVPGLAERLRAAYDSFELPDLDL